MEERVINYMKISHVTNTNAKSWAELCNELWPHNSVIEMLKVFKNGEYKNEYLYQINDIYVAFLSLSIRNDYVEGKIDSNPVAYLEGIYVKPLYRRNGIARELVNFAKTWAVENGSSMIASDCELSNKESRIFHNSIGFDEANVNVHFTMKLR